MAEQVDQNHRSKLLASHEYKAGGTKVEISAREFLPFKEHKNQQEALVLFLGWGPNEKASSYNELALSLADSFDRRVLLVNTRPRDLVEDSLYHEADATHKFLEEMNITDAILAGYSQGGAKATNLAVISQERSTVNPEALILLAPVGLDDQSPSRLLATFALDTVGQTVPRILTEKVIAKSKDEGGRIKKLRKSLFTAKDVAKGQSSEAVQSKANYPKRLAHEVNEMSQRNPRLKELEVPVILIQGQHDKSVGPKGILTKEQMARQDEEGAVKKALKELFPKSPNVERILARRTSKHAFPLLRSPQIARVASYLLKRQKPEG
jgi:pimeloyl-ACP methyl ester carboxylesterase